MFPLLLRDPLSSFSFATQTRLSNVTLNMIIIIYFLDFTADFRRKFKIKSKTLASFNIVTIAQLLFIL